LIDNELTLVAPEMRWVDEVMQSCAHPLTLRDAPLEASMTRQKLQEFIANVPLGRQPADPGAGRVPAYHFWMRLEQAAGEPPIQIAGGIGFRMGINHEIEFYSGNIGYHVYPAARVHHLAERACRLVLPLAR